jgi:fatty acid desaturase
MLTSRDFRDLFKLNNLYTGAYLLATYLSILGVLYICFKYPSFYVFAIGYLLIGTLQHHLLILHHEATHYMLFSNKWWNDFCGSLIGFMIGFTMAYRESHLLHHKRLGEKEDPGLENYSNYPNTRTYLFIDVIKNLFMLGAVIQFFEQSLLISKKDDQDSNLVKKIDKGLIGVFIVQLSLLLTFWACGAWYLYFILWLFPVVTVTKFLAHFRNVAEHVIISQSPNIEYSRLRTILCNPIEAFFFAPMNFNYHAEHHLYPQVPYHNLPKLHAILSQEEEYSELQKLETSYLDILLNKTIKK